MDFIFYSLINFQYHRIKRCFFIGNFDEDFFLYTINGPDASEASGPLVYEAVQSASTAARTSSIKGMDAAAPGRVTEMAEAMDAYCMAV